MITKKQLLFIFLLMAFFMPQTTQANYTKKLAGISAVSAIATIASLYHSYKEKCIKLNDQPSFKNFRVFVKLYFNGLTNKKTFKSTVKKHPKLSTIVATTAGLTVTTFLKLIYDFYSQNLEIQKQQALQKAAEDKKKKREQERVDRIEEMIENRLAIERAQKTKEEEDEKKRKELQLQQPNPTTLQAPEDPVVESIPETPAAAPTPTSPTSPNPKIPAVEITPKTPPITEEQKKAEDLARKEESDQKIRQEQREITLAFFNFVTQEIPYDQDPTLEEKLINIEQIIKAINFEKIETKCNEFVKSHRELILATCTTEEQKRDVNRQHNLQQDKVDIVFATFKRIQKQLNAYGVANTEEVRDNLLYKIPAQQRRRDQEKFRDMSVDERNNLLNCPSFLNNMLQEPLGEKALLDHLGNAKDPKDADAVLNHLKNKPQISLEKIIRNQFLNYFETQLEDYSTSQNLTNEELINIVKENTKSGFTALTYEKHPADWIKNDKVAHNLFFYEQICLGQSPEILAQIEEEKKLKELRDEISRKIKELGTPQKNLTDIMKENPEIKELIDEVKSYYWKEDPA